VTSLISSKQVLSIVPDLSDPFSCLGKNLQLEIENALKFLNNFSYNKRKFIPEPDNHSPISSIGTCNSIINDDLKPFSGKAHILLQFLLPKLEDTSFAIIRSRLQSIEKSLGGKLPVNFYTGEEFTKLTGIRFPIQEGERAIPFNYYAYLYREYTLLPLTDPHDIFHIASANFAGPASIMMSRLFAIPSAIAESHQYGLNPYSSVIEMSHSIEMTTNGWDRVKAWETCLHYARKFNLSFQFQGQMLSAGETLDDTKVL